MIIRNTYFKSRYIVVRRLIVLTVFLLIPGRSVYSQGLNTGDGPMLMETVILSTDKSLYLPGEKILFYASINEADNYTISSLSKIFRFELLNSEGSALIQEKFEVVGGRISQQIELPGSLPSGWYQIRAYSNWMRNFKPDYFSSVNIRIINPAELSKVIVSDNPEKINIEMISYHGDLIMGTVNECALRVTDGFGNPYQTEGSLMANNDTILNFRSGESGWTSILFKPQTGLNYYFVTNSQKNPEIKSLIPQIKSSGNTVQINSAPGSLEIMFKQLGPINVSKVRLLVHSQYTWYWYSSKELSGDIARFSIPLQNLPVGLVQATLLDEQGNILVSRLLSTNEPVSAGSQIELEPLSGESDDIRIARFSTNKTGSEGLYNLLVRRKEPEELTSVFIPGLPGWPVRYEIPYNSDERYAWMMANSYSTTIVHSFFNDLTGEPIVRTINFKDLTVIRESRVNFMPETRGLTINGEIKNNGTELPLGNLALSLTVLGDNSFYTAKTHPNGKFHFSLPDREGQDDMILAYAISPDPKWQLIIYPEFDDKKARLPASQLTLSMAELNYIRDQSILFQLNEVYKPELKISADTGSEKTNSKPMFFGYPDRVVFLDDFIRLPNIREVLYEVVPSVITRKENDKYIIRIANGQPFPKQYNPLVLLDGIPLIKFEELLEMSPDRFRKIEVIENLYVHGNNIFAGIVNFVSVNGDLAGLDLPEGSQIVSMRMPLLPENIDLNQDIVEASNEPQLSGILKIIPFFNDGMGSISFRTNDNYGEYIISVRGFTNAGQWVLSTLPFEVKGSFIGK